MMHFKLFPNCKIVLGSKNAVLYDLDREKIEMVPLDFANLLLELDAGHALTEVKSVYALEEQAIIDINLKYFSDNEYGIFCSKELFDCFPKMSLDFSQPSEVTNAIIELKISAIFYLNQYLKQLEDLGCFYISIIMYEKLNEKLFIDIFNQIPSDRIKSVELISVWNEDISDGLFSRITPYAQQITKLIFTASPYDKTESWNRERNILFYRQFTKEVIKNFSHCGKIETKYFNPNLSNFLESVNHNSCLNKKVSIDINGNIKNCPAFSENFGNVKNQTLRGAISQQGFKKYWNLTKDHITVCKDCEFRYVCTDCRAFTENNILNNGIDVSKPLKCGYDPYTGVWEEWSINPLRNKNMRDDDNSSLN